MTFQDLLGEREKQTIVKRGICVRHDRLRNDEPEFQTDRKQAQNPAYVANLHEHQITSIKPSYSCRGSDSEHLLSMSIILSSASVLIPACNEEESLADTIAAIQKHSALFMEMEIIVINDGSRDRTGEIARALPVTLIEHEITRGYGASLKDGL